MCKTLMPNGRHFKRPMDSGQSKSESKPMFLQKTLIFLMEMKKVKNKHSNLKEQSGGLILPHANT